MKLEEESSPPKKRKKKVWLVSLSLTSAKLATKKLDSLDIIMSASFLRAEMAAVENGPTALLG